MKYFKNNRNTRKHHPPIPKKDNTETNSKMIQNKYYYISQLELKKGINAKQ
jgi:hypothetical protein